MNIPSSRVNQGIRDYLLRPSTRSCGKFYWIGQPLSSARRNAVWPCERLVLPVNAGRRSMNWFLIIAASFGFQKFEQFGPGHQYFAAESAARLELVALNQTIDAEIVDPEQIGRFSHRICKPFSGGGRFFSLRYESHVASFHSCRA